MILIRDLHHRYPDGTQALRGIDLSIDEGELLLLCGPNGSGKTTLIRHIKGLILPTSGMVSVDGLNLSEFPGEVIKRVGMVFQDADSQILGETVWEDVAFGPENLGLSREEIQERVAQTLRAVGLEGLAEKPCHLLSGGEKRRVAIAGVLAMEPRILIFDEPFANLDYHGVRQALGQILDLHSKGCTVILTTHDVEKVIAHVDRVAVLFGGELKALGTPDEVLPLLPACHVRRPCYSILGAEPVSWLTD